MPFLLLDDATQEAQRRLQEYGSGLLTNLQQANQPPLQNVRRAAAGTGCPTAHAAAAAPATQPATAAAAPARGPAGHHPAFAGLWHPTTPGRATTGSAVEPATIRGSSAAARAVRATRR